MKPNLLSLLENSKSVLLILPKNPYFEQVAAATALTLALKGRYDVFVHSPTPMVVEFNRLVGVDKVTTELGNKNLVITLKDTYPASNVERVLYDTDGVAMLTLTVVPKPGVVAPAQTDFNFTMSGVAADTVILIGGANDSHFPALEMKDLLETKLIHIGREALTLQNREVHSLARPSSSLSELVATLLRESEIEIERDAATNLLMGITEGTRNFVGPDVTSDTFRIVADLLDRGGKRTSPNPQNTSGAGRPPLPYRPPQVPTQPQTQSAPKSWLEPKIYKGSNVS